MMQIIVIYPGHLSLDVASQFVAIRDRRISIGPPVILTKSQSVRYAYSDEISMFRVQILLFYLGSYGVLYTC